MYEVKKLDFGFVILCPERNINGLRGTIRSIGKYHDVPCLCVVPKETKKAELDEMKEVCKTIRGGSTYTSLINKGLEKTGCDWNFVIFAGSFIRPLFYRRYVVFVDNEKDILFPIVDGRVTFYEGSMNGILLHKKAIKEIGKMDEVSEDLEKVKLKWAYEAVERGYKFKAIHGVKVM